jgi:hypothetical protein
MGKEKKTKRNKFSVITDDDIVTYKALTNKFRVAIAEVSKILVENGFTKKYVGPHERFCEPMNLDSVAYSLFHFDGMFPHIVEVQNFMSPMRHFDLRLLKLASAEQVVKFVHKDMVYEQASENLKKQRYELYLELKKEFEDKPNA